MFNWKFWQQRSARPAHCPMRGSRRRSTRFESLEQRQMMTTSGDFNGDGIQDLAIGLPGKDIGRFVDAGQVSVLYGTVRTGLATPANQLWDLSRPGLRGNTRTGDRFGAALAVGDFNFDGYDDLAIAAPGKEVNDLKGAGAVTVLYGSVNGLVATGSQFWTADDISAGDGAQKNAGFGTALATGDFNADGYSDLAIGAPQQDRGSNKRIGAVYVLYGTVFGLNDNNSQIWSQKTTNLNATPRLDARFGAALASGDFDGDDVDDLAIGAPGNRPFATTNVIYGTFSGLSTIGNQRFNYGGTALATGDFDADEYDDLAIGETNDRTRLGGVVSVVHGSDEGLLPRVRQIYTLTSIGGKSARGDSFGASLAVGDFNGDRYDDLVVGAPLATVNGVARAGLVQVLYGSLAGPTAVGTRQFSQGPGVNDQAPSNTLYGSALAVGDYNGDGFADLAVGVPKITWNSKVAVGIAWAYYGSTNGVTTINDQLWRMGLPGMLGSPTANDNFGAALA